MVTIKVFVGGLESSGNHWFHSVLCQHPKLDVVQASFPFGLHPRVYPQIPDGFIHVIPVRDSTCHRRSVVRMGYESEHPGQFTDEESIAVLSQSSKTFPGVIFASYETALVFRQVCWDWLFQLIGVKSIAVNTEYLDGNLKYFGADHP